MDENAHEQDSLAQARRVVPIIDVVYEDGAYLRVTRAVDGTAAWRPARGGATLPDAEALFAIFTDPAGREAFTRQNLARARRAS